MSRTLLFLLFLVLFFPSNSFASETAGLLSKNYGFKLLSEGLPDNGIKETLPPEPRHIEDYHVFRHEMSPDLTSEIPDSSNFTVGLALSGGGAAGLAHIGVLKVFEEAGIPVDLVTGTSMGAIVGALYAMGYSPELMEHELQTADWRTLFEETIDRIHLPLEEKPYDRVFNITFPIEKGRIQLPTGLVSGNHIFNLLALYTWPYHDIEDFSQLPRPFLCIATDLETGEQVILDRGFLPDAIRASMSIPSVFVPVWIENRFLVDGGVVNNLPVKEAFDFGADFVIAINSSSDLKPAEELLSLPDILTQTIAVGMQSTMHIQRDRADFYIQPDLTRYTTLSFGDVAEIIQAGEKAARSQIDQIRSLADSLNQLRSPNKYDSIPVFQPLDKIPIRSVYYEGLLSVPEDHIRSKLRIFDNTTIDKLILDEGLSRLLGMKRFDRITYRLIWADDKADLIIYFQEQTANIIQTGFFHNNITGPSLLFNTTFRNLLFPASTARIDARVGHEGRLIGHYFNYIGIEPRLAFTGSAGFREREMFLYDGNRRMASLQTDLIFAEGLIGTLHASVFRAGIGYRVEHFRLSENIGLLDTPSGWNFLHHLTSELEFDNLNRSVLPTSGHHLWMRADFKPYFFPEDKYYWRLEGSWRSYNPVSETFSLIHNLQGGYHYGYTMPFHYNFFAGGFNSFHGYQKDAISGNNLLAFYIAAQSRFYRNFYLTPGLNVGTAYPKINLDVFDTPLKWGWSVILSWDTFIGPIETVLSGSGDHALLFEFQVGLNLR